MYRDWCDEKYSCFALTFRFLEAISVGQLANGALYTSLPKLEIVRSLPAQAGVDVDRQSLKRIVVFYSLRRFGESTSVHGLTTFSERCHLFNTLSNN